MGGIRKKTTKRGTTFQRSKIQKKAAETRKKNNRDGKKDVTWKSKKTKDPGIPNNYPYKDEVLAEMAQQKRLDDEAKEARRQAQKLDSAAARQSARDKERDAESDDEENPGIMSLHNKAGITATKAITSNGASSSSAVATAGPSVPPPQLVDTLLPTIQSALDRSQIIIEVLDARDPNSFRSLFLENLISETKGKDKLLLVLNKVDLIPLEAASAWLKFLRTDVESLGMSKGSVKVVGFKSSIKTEGKVVAGDVASLKRALPWGREGVLEVLKGWEVELKKGQAEGEPVAAAVLGLPNVGKSAFINTLLSQPFLPTAPLVPLTSSKGNSTTTLTPIEVTLELSPSSKISIIDTPGWEFNDPDLGPLGDEQELDIMDDEDEDELMENLKELTEEEIDERNAKWDLLEELAAKDNLTRNVGRIDKAKDVSPLIKQIVSRANPQDLMLAYNVPAYRPDDVPGFLTSVARAHQRIKKFGVADLDAAARIILRDWSHNTFPHYTLPPKSQSGLNQSNGAFSGNGMEVDGREDEDVLKEMKTKREMKRESVKGLIKLKVGEVDNRELIMDEEYVNPANFDSDSEGDEDDEEDFEGMMMDVEELDEEDLEDDDEEDEDGQGGEGSESGEEVVFSNDDEPSPSESDDEEEEERSPTPPPALVSSKGNKRKRMSEGIPAPIAVKKAKKVAFPKALESPRTVPNGKGKEVEKPTSILKRKSRDDDSDGEETVGGKGKGKKARVGGGGLKVVEAQAEPERPIAGKKGKKVEKAKVVEEEVAAPVAKVVKSKPAKKEKKLVAATPIVPPPTSKKIKASEVVPEGEKPYDFAAHFF